MMKRKKMSQPKEIEVRSGEDIRTVISRAIRTAGRDQRMVEFTFNGCRVIVRKNSNPRLVYRDWDRAMSGCIGKIIGPKYKTELSIAEKKKYAAAKAKSEARACQCRLYAAGGRYFTSDYME